MGQNITMEQAKAMLEQDGGIVLLDVRMPDEYEKGHIKGSVNIPLNQIPAIGQRYPDKATKFLVYCQSGKRSAKACVFLEKLGYAEPCNMGGFPDWHYETEIG